MNHRQAMVKSYKDHIEYVGTGVTAGDLAIVCHGLKRDSTHYIDTFITPILKALHLIGELDCVRASTGTFYYPIK